MVEKTSKIVNFSNKDNQKGLQQRCINKKKIKLTFIEKEILYFLHIECLIPSQIAQRSKISKLMVSKFIKKLKLLTTSK